MHYQVKMYLFILKEITVHKECVYIYIYISNYAYLYMKNFSKQITWKWQQFVQFDMLTALSD